MQLYAALQKKHADVRKHLQDGVSTWNSHAVTHAEFDMQVARCQQQISAAEKFDEEICSQAYKLQSQLLLEPKVKVGRLYSRLIERR